MNKLIVFSLLISTAAFGQSLPRVLILDFKNKSGNASLGYLEGSITEAVTAEMKKRFTYRDTPAEQWKPVAQKNFFYEPDHATDSAAMNLGLLTQQDVVISGNILPGKNANNAVVSVGIFDIGQKKKIEELSIPLSLTANMFGDIEQIALKVSDTAGKVLPNKDDWNRSGLGNFMEKKRHQITLVGSAGLLPYATTVNNSLNEGVKISAENFQVKVNIQLTYETDLPWFRNIFGWTGGAVELGSRSFVTDAGGTVKGSLFSYAILAGAGWHMLERVRWRLSLLAGAGAYIQNIRFDYASETVSALNASTLGIESGKSLETLGIIAPLALRFSYRLTPEINLLTSAGIQGRFFRNSQGFSGYFALGAGYTF